MSRDLQKGDLVEHKHVPGVILEIHEVEQVGRRPGEMFAHFTIWGVCHTVDDDLKIIADTATPDQVFQSYASELRPINPLVLLAIEGK